MPNGCLPSGRLWGGDDHLIETEDLILAAIPVDFDVKRISSSEGLWLFAAERKDYFHFVTIDQENGLRQFLIPHFRAARAINRHAEQSEKATIHPLDGEELGLLVQSDGPPAILTQGLCILLNGAGDELASGLMRAAKSYAKAVTSVTCEAGSYSLPGVKTHFGNPLAAPSRELIAGIALEKSLLRRLSATRTFGLYSAFSTHRDLPCPLDREETLYELWDENRRFYEAAQSQSLEFEKLAAAVQQKLLPSPIWDGKPLVPPPTAVRTLAAGMARLTQAQRTQFVLGNGMVEGSLFLTFAAVLGVISFADYGRMQTRWYQPDAAQTQKILRTCAYIDLFGELAHSAGVPQ
jgi:hypothetical protein